MILEELVVITAFDVNPESCLEHAYKQHKHIVKVRLACNSNIDVVAGDSIFSL